MDPVRIRALRPPRHRGPGLPVVLPHTVPGPAPAGGRLGLLGWALLTPGATGAASFFLGLTPLPAPGRTPSAPVPPVAGGTGATGTRPLPASRGWQPPA
jgi:hypothetical protein